MACAAIIDATRRETREVDRLQQIAREAFRKHDLVTAWEKFAVSVEELHTRVGQWRNKQRNISQLADIDKQMRSVCVSFNLILNEQEWEREDVDLFAFYK